MKLYSKLRSIELENENHKQAQKVLELDTDRMREKYDKIDLENRKSFNKIQALQNEKFKANQFAEKLQK